MNGSTELGQFLAKTVLKSALEAAVFLWPLIAIVIAFTILKVFLKGFATNWIFDFRNGKLINRSRTVRDLLTMGPIQFEHLCRMLFEMQGYKVSVTRPTNDGGVDITGMKGDERIIAQCKRYTKHTVGRPELQQFYGTFEDNSADRGFFLTTSRFSEPAVKFAAKKPIELVDRDRLVLWINRYASGKIETEVPSPAPTPTPQMSSAPTQPPRDRYPAVCAACGKETMLPFEPAKGKPVYCRDCYLARQTPRRK